jgi:hypothetical protein
MHHFYNQNSLSTQISIAGAMYLFCNGASTCSAEPGLDS